MIEYVVLFCLPGIEHGNGKSIIYSIDDVPIQMAICRGFPVAMFDYQRVTGKD